MNRKRTLLGMIILSCLCLGCANPVLCFSRQDDQGQPAKAAAQESPSKIPQHVLKTYTLKHIKPEAILDIALLYVSEAKHFENILTVRIWDHQIAKFEELLNKLDVEKKIIQFQVFAIVASRDQDGERKTILPSPSPKTSPSEKEKYIGEPITLKYKETDLRDVVLGLAQFTRLNVIFDADVRGVVTCNFQDVPWDQALDIILKQNNMGKTIEGKVLRIAPLRILSREQNPEKGDAIENKDLKKVLDELKTLWSFKTYEVDGPSFLSVHEDSGPNNFKLVTNRALNLVVSNVKVLGDESGKRTVSIGQLKLTGMANFVDYVYVDTADVTLKEKGYLVAGVSGYGSAARALILVISAEIK